MRPDRMLAPALLAALALLAGCGDGSIGGVKKESAASQRQDAARTRTDLGQKYMQQGKLEIALENLNKALEYDSSYVDAHTVIAVLYESINNPAKAGEHYRRATELKPKGGAEANNYGWFLCRQGRYDESQVYFDRALADPFYQTPALAMGNSGACLLKAGKREEAEKRLRAALDANPQDAEALVQLATLLYEKGEYLKARGFIQRFESIAPYARPDALLLARNIELRLGNANAASDYTRKLMQGFPESEQARSLSAQRSS
ncbi:type IV pilus biogenesis/stability protein PilW [Dokdonella sp.]|uniref:type IV pilus biogenesis/stability protein PilW n=1 Tax=Dokdonella sp. TaxID=2291710 RepID=UPI00263604F0|nr:type IV pilus biogenesis/stability protein PilW [Dokdonella sp.]